MPVEIKELVIRAVVGDPTEPGSSSGPSRSGPEDGVEGGSGVDPQAMVEECVRQVLAILRQSRER